MSLSPQMFHKQSSKWHKWDLCWWISNEMNCCFVMVSLNTSCCHRIKTPQLICIWHDRMEEVGEQRGKIKERMSFPVLLMWNMNLTLNEDHTKRMFFFNLGTFYRGTAFLLLLFKSICCDRCKVAWACCMLQTSAFKREAQTMSDWQRKVGKKWSNPISYSILPQSHLVLKYPHYQGWPHSSHTCL